MSRLTTATTATIGTSERGSSANAVGLRHVMPKVKFVPVNERGKRIGEGHPRAKLSDHEVGLVLALLEERARIWRQLADYGLARSEIQTALRVAQLNRAGIAEKFEISKWHVIAIESGRRRGQYATKWKRAEPA